jgi:succinyl-diaminopimelate desuccinylase
MSRSDPGVEHTPGSAANSLREELALATLELCRIPSETLHEREIADGVEVRCREQMGDAGVHRVGNSVVCVAPEPAESLPTVALVGHLDTVKCALDQPAEIREGRVYGCGASDMKGGVAVMLALLSRWRELRRARPVWIFYDGEEGPAEGNGLEPVLRSGVLPPLDFAYVLEPTDRSLQMGCMGTMHAVVTVHGQRAHSARPWQGTNALFEAVPLLERFLSVERRDVRIGDLVYYEVMVPTQAWTENSKNVVPERVMINVNLRFAPGRTAEDAERELRQLVGDRGDVAVIDQAPAGAVYLQHPLVEPWRAREGIPVACKQAWTDVARFTERGIPAVNFGPGETAQAHQAGEWCSIDSLEFAYGALWRFFTA